MESRRLAPSGWGRYAESTFLVIWLAFWVVGELVAILFLGATLVNLVSKVVGATIVLGVFGSVVTDGAASLFLFGIIFWLALWTFGGWAAGVTFLRNLAGEDRVAVTPQGLQFTRRAGPFSRTRLLPLSSIRRVRVRPHDKAVVADTSHGTFTIADLGTPVERESVERWITERLQLPDHSRAVLLERETSPHDWSVRVDGMDTVLTSPPPRIARIQAALGWGVTTLMALGWVDALGRGVNGPGAFSSGERAAVAITAVSAVAAMWLTMARREWRLRPGAMRLRLRAGRWMLRERAFERGFLEIEYRADSDGDRHWTLVVRDSAGRRVLSRALHDHYELVALGEWLGARTGFPFHRPSP